jgi:hypothetical protein
MVCVDPLMVYVNSSYLAVVGCERDERWRKYGAWKEGWLARMKE